MLIKMTHVSSRMGWEIDELTFHTMMVEMMKSWTVSNNIGLGDLMKIQAKRKDLTEGNLITVGDYEFIKVKECR